MDMEEEQKKDFKFFSEVNDYMYEFNRNHTVRIYVEDGAPAPDLAKTTEQVGQDLLKQFFKNYPQIAADCNHDKSSMTAYAYEGDDADNIGLPGHEDKVIIPKKYFLVQPNTVYLSLKNGDLATATRGTASILETQHSVGKYAVALGNGEAVDLNELTKDGAQGSMRKATWMSWIDDQQILLPMQQQSINALKRHGSTGKVKSGGHSWGGATAATIGAEAAKMGFKDVSVYTFGGLTMFNKQAETWFNKKKIKCFNLWNAGDPVPQLDRYIQRQKEALAKGIFFTVHGDFDLAVMDHEDWSVVPKAEPPSSKVFSGSLMGKTWRANVKGGLRAIGPLTHMNAVYKAGCFQANSPYVPLEKFKGNEAPIDLTAQKSGTKSTL